MVSKVIFVCRLYLNDFFLLKGDLQKRIQWLEVLSKVSKEQKTFKIVPMQTKKGPLKKSFILKISSKGLL